MDTVAISRTDLKKMMRETFIEVLSKRKDLIENAVLDAMEDMALGIAMKKGSAGVKVSKDILLSKIDQRIKHLKCK